MSSEGVIDATSSSSMTEDALKTAVLEVLANIDPSLVSFRQIKQRLLEEHQIMVDDKKEFILNVIEEFFAGDDDEDADEEDQEEGTAEDEHEEEEENEEGEQDDQNKRTTRNRGASSSSSRRKSHDGDEESRGAVLKKRTGGGFAQPVLLSYDLADFLGKRVALRTEVTKLMWDYIKLHNLQNPEKKSEILCDEKMEKLFKRKKMQMFKMTKFLSGMMKSTKEVQASCLSDDEDDEETEKKTSKKKTQTKRKREEDVGDNDEDGEEEAKESKSKTGAKKDGGKTKAVYKLVNGKSRLTTVSTEVKEENPKPAKGSKKVKVEKQENDEDNEPKKKANGLSKACAVTPALLRILSMDENESHSRPQVVSKMWEYIRANNLQNPNDKREIILDQALQELFKVKKFTMFSMNKYLSSHVKNLDG